MQTLSSPSPGQLVLVPPADVAEEAYHRARPELDTVSDDELGRVTANVMVAVLVMLGAVPRLEALRKEIEALPGQAPGLIDKARDYALALAHVQAMGTPAPEGRLEALLAEGLPLRERLLATAELNAKLGTLDAEQVAAIRSGVGHVDAANDLLSLARLFRANWHMLAGKVPVTRDEIDRAGALGVELLSELGRRKVGNDGGRPAGGYERARAKLLHLLVRTHGQLLRAVTYLRWDEGDADAIVPSLFQGRPRRRRVAEPPTPTPAEPPAPPPAEPPTPTPAEPLAPTPTEPPAPTPAEPGNPDERGGLDGA
ncbi:MAG TPA: hypothetical protein VFS43_30325 [Polyangiaceae bacterium]|nr:hypothetical protein [Polyangiaceae bacterium]